MLLNLKKFDLSWCNNLVEIETSVGRLDRLEMGGIFGLCFSLRTPPTRQLEAYHMGAYVMSQDLSFEIGNLTGIRELHIQRSSVFSDSHLPAGIYNLQHIETLHLYGNFIFAKDMEIDRQPLCNSLGGFPKYVFPSLKNLSLYFFYNLSELDFILNYCCPVTLETLDIFYDKSFTLPESISRCERLHSLHIRLGKDFHVRLGDELREIPRLPPSLRYLKISTIFPLMCSISVIHRVSLLNLN